jgi:hypothetical protein
VTEDSALSANIGALDRMRDTGELTPDQHATALRVLLERAAVSNPAEADGHTREGEVSAAEQVSSAARVPAAVRDASDALRAVGLNGQVVVDREWLTISRKGLRAMLNQGLKGDKRIHLGTVTSVQFKPAGVTSGYIQFTFAGGAENKFGLVQAGSDENTVLFGPSQLAAFEAIRLRGDPPSCRVGNLGPLCPARYNAS